MRDRLRLPRTDAQGKWLFVTWHLADSLPHDKIQPGSLIPARIFQRIDRDLDAARQGPRYLSQQPIAQAISEALYLGMLRRHYRLGPYALLANHLHMLILPKANPLRMLESLKTATGLKANLLMGRLDGRFWESGSYTHWVADQREWARIASYVEDNPVKAGLVERAEDYPWSSAFLPKVAGMERSVL